MSHTHAPAIESRAAIFRHPIHPMLIAFPTAALMATPLADGAAAATGDRFFRRASRWLLLGGLTSGLAASAVGLIDYLGVAQIRRQPGAHVHAGGNALVMALAALNLSRRDPDDDVDPDGSAFALSVATVALLGITAWLGGELSYRHGVGMIASDPAGRAPKREVGR